MIPNANNSNSRRLYTSTSSINANNSIARRFIPFNQRLSQWRYTSKSIGRGIKYVFILRSGILKTMAFPGIVSSSKRSGAERVASFLPPRTLTRSSLLIFPRLFARRCNLGCWYCFALAWSNSGVGIVQSRVSSIFDSGETIGLYRATLVRYTFWDPVPESLDFLRKKKDQKLVAI